MEELDEVQLSACDAVPVYPCVGRIAIPVSELGRQNKHRLTWVCRQGVELPQAYMKQREVNISITLSSLSLSRALA